MAHRIIVADDNDLLRGIIADILQEAASLDWKGSAEVSGFLKRFLFAHYRSGDARH